MWLYARPASLIDAQEMAPFLREADVSEVKASSGRTPESALDKAVRSSLFPVAVCEHGTDMAEAIFGVVPVTDLSGAIWMLGTDRLVKTHGFEFARRCKSWIDQLHRQRPLLFNYVDVRNDVHVRWLRWTGFHFINRHEAHGYERRPFYEFIRIKNNV